MKKLTILLLVLLGTYFITLSSCNKEDDCVEKIWYQDIDGDGFGNTNVTKKACTQPEGYVEKSGDCQDTIEEANPDAEEIMNNGIDDDCDGTIDECPPSIECDCNDGLDNDDDGQTDCNDSDCLGSIEIECDCNDGIDNDGDGFTDCDDFDCEGSVDC